MMLFCRLILTHTHTSLLPSALTPIQKGLGRCNQTHFLNESKISFCRILDSRDGYYLLLVFMIQCVSPVMLQSTLKFFKTYFSTLSYFKNRIKMSLKSKINMILVRNRVTQIYIETTKQWYPKTILNGLIFCGMPPDFH